MTTEPPEEPLLAALCRDGRADVRELAAAIDEAPTTVQNRIRTLEEDGAIDGYTARIDYERLGYQTVLFRLAVELDRIDAVTARLRDRPLFVTVYQMSGADTVFAVGKFATEAAVGPCLRELHDDTDVRRIEIDRVRAVRREGDSPLVGD